MSIGGDGMGQVADEFSDLEHQVIRQNQELNPQENVSVTPGDPGSEFDPGERELDREEVAQLVFYRRYATLNMDVREQTDKDTNDRGEVDASIGINGDLFREVTTNNEISARFDVDTGGEIGLIDNYALSAHPQNDFGGGGVAGGTTDVKTELVIEYYDWPTGGPVVDSFDTITAGFGAGNESEEAACDIELRYDLYWDVVETGETTSPFGRP
jgi:hypothetical protein